MSIRFKRKKQTSMSAFFIFGFTVSVTLSDSRGLRARKR